MVLKLSAQQGVSINFEGPEQRLNENDWGDFVTIHVGSYGSQHYQLELLPSSHLTPIHGLKKGMHQFRMQVELPKLVYMFKH